jgi:hypothetical protein
MRHPVVAILFIRCYNVMYVSFAISLSVLVLAITMLLIGH